MSVPSDPRWSAFARAFEEGRYFDAHEILEAYWMSYDGEDRSFFQGLIQAAVALHHASRGNAAGARGVAASCRRRLAPWGPTHRGLDVEGFLENLDAAIAGGEPAPSLHGWEGAA